MLYQNCRNATPSSMSGYSCSHLSEPLQGPGRQAPEQLLQLLTLQRPLLEFSVKDKPCGDEHPLGDAPHRPVKWKMTVIKIKQATVSFQWQDGEQRGLFLHQLNKTLAQSVNKRKLISQSSIRKKQNTSSIIFLKI